MRKTGRSSTKKEKEHEISAFITAADDDVDGGHMELNRLRSRSRHRLGEPAVGSS